MLMAAGPLGRIAAERADRAAAYRCPGCDGAVTLKRGPVVVAHFAHARASACAFARGETAEHLGAKHALAQAFAGRGLVAELEAEILSADGDRRADILVRDPASGRRVAIEVQHSALSLEAIERRTRAYAAAGVPVIWVATLDPVRLGARRLSASGLWAIDRYALADWQRFAFAYHGVLWFWHAGALWRGWLDGAWVARAPRRGEDDYADDDGEPGLKRSARWGALTLAGPFPPGALRIKPRASRIEAHERFALPAGYSANFLKAGERTQPDAPTAIAWRERADRFLPALVRARRPEPTTARAARRPFGDATARRAA